MSEVSRCLMLMAGRDTDVDFALVVALTKTQVLVHKAILTRHYIFCFCFVLLCTVHCFDLLKDTDSATV